MKIKGSTIISGQDGFEEIEFFDTPVRLKEKDIVVLMSDGLYEGTDWKRIEELLAGSRQVTAESL